MPDDIESEVAETYGVDPSRVHDQAASKSTGTSSDTGQEEQVDTDEDPLPLTLVVPGKPPSLNQFFSGMHWARRKKVRDEWHRKVRLLAPEVEIETYPLHIESITYWGKGEGRRYDAENVVMAAKLITDSLIEAGVLREDGPKEIRRVSLEARRMEEEGHETRYRLSEHPT